MALIQCNSLNSIQIESSNFLHLSRVGYEKGTDRREVHSISSMNAKWLDAPIHVVFISWCFVSYVFCHTRIIYLEHISCYIWVMEQTVTVPLRICKTCGLEKSLDHFVSLYTDTITNNCDFCRSRQRQQYKGGCSVLRIMDRNATSETARQTWSAS